MAKKDIFLLLIVVIIWGLNFSVIKLGLENLDPFVLTALRFFFSAIPFVFFIKKPDLPLKYMITYGLLFGVGLWGMVSLGIFFGLSAGLSSLVLQISVFISIFLAAILFKEKISFIKKIAFFIALFGLALIMTVTDGSVSLLGILFVLLAALAMGLTNIFVKKTKIKNLFSFMVYSSFFSPIPLLILAYLTSGSEAFIFTWQTFDFNTIFSILFQAYPVTLFGYWVWNSSINKYPISLIAPFGLLVPISGFLGSYLIYDENIGFLKLIASLMIFMALVINVYGDKIYKFYTKGRKE